MVHANAHFFVVIAGRAQNIGLRSGVETNVWLGLGRLAETRTICRESPGAPGQGNAPR
jgi:hypothetical protein